MVLSFRQLVFLAIMVSLAASKMVSLSDIGFVIFTYVYLCLFLSKLAFPGEKTARQGRLSDPNNKLFRAYFISTALIGLVFPVCYITIGIFNGNKTDIEAAAPHLFLLAAQAFMEPVCFSPRFSWPIGILLPVFYNARRIFALVDWLRSEFSEAEPMNTGGRFSVGRVLSSVNMAVWCYNLFGLLLPVYLPRACKMYYSDNKEDK